VHSSWHIPNGYHPMQVNHKRRVVVTGLGAVAPNGTGIKAFWDATCKGISGITAFPPNYPLKASVSIRVAGVIRNFATQAYVDRKLLNRTDRMTHLALAAIQEALYDANLIIEQENPQHVGIVIANTLGGVDFVMKQFEALYARGPRSISTFTAIAWLHIANVGQTSIRYGIQGYCKTPVNDAVGGLDAIGMAYAAIQRGAADVIIAGGCEASLHPFYLMMLAQQGLFFSGDDPHGYRPFDQRADGLVVGEGAGICILEDYEHALQRGAEIYGEIVGYGQTNDANGFAPPSADGRQYARAMQLALQEGHIEPSEIAYINLDGRAFRSSDAGEAHALSLTFGPDLKHLPVSVPRTMIGHTYAAAGALDTIIALLALQHGLIPPTINVDDLIPDYGLDMVRDEARELYRFRSNHIPQAVLIGGRGIGGANVVLAVKKA
jgi:3-oxoacyl-(acyl-carrier-protein) synthase